MVDKVSTGLTEGKGYPIQGWGAWESSRGGGIAGRDLYAGTWSQILLERERSFPNSSLGKK